MDAHILPELEQTDLPRQRQLVKALHVHGYFLRNFRVHETDTSWVLMTGRDAYKIKKSFHPGYADFSTLAARRFYCEEELRLNRRFATDLYLGVVPIGGKTKHPAIGEGPAMEYAVHMRRFAQSGMMNRMLSNGDLTASHIDKLAGVIADFHAAQPGAPADSPFCAPDELMKRVGRDFSDLLQLLHAPNDLAMLESIRRSLTAEFISRASLFRYRAGAGCVRECHGNLDLGHVVMLDGTPTPFDSLAFDPARRWIDVISEISFTAMDLLHAGQPQLAWRLFNRYLEITGDYSGAGLLHFYLAYHAVSHARMTAARAAQRGTAKAKADLKSCRGYLRLAENSLAHHNAALIITHGLPGCGKSTFAQLAVERQGAIRIRSDAERRRLFGLKDKKAVKSRTDIYSDDATRRTYARMRELARGLLAAGFTVIVDAAFVRHDQRENFRALADELDIPFIIASFQTDIAIMEARMQERSNIGNDASEADISVLRKLQLAQAPLLEEELDSTVTFNNNDNVDALRSENNRGWKQLDTRLLARYAYRARTAG